MPHQIRHCIISPSLPGAHHALMARAAELGHRADRLKVPWELVAGSSAFRQAVIDASKTYLKVHQGETVHIFTRPGYARIAGDIADAWYEAGRKEGIVVDIQEIRILYFQDYDPTTLVWTCGDGRYCQLFVCKAAG